MIIQIEIQTKQSFDIWTKYYGRQLGAGRGPSLPAASGVGFEVPEYLAEATGVPY